MSEKPTYEELEKIINELKKELEKKEDYNSKSQRNKVIGSIGHEFNNLLMGIQGNISLIFLDINKSNPFYNKLKDIETYIEGGVKLTEKLLDFIIEGKFEPKENVKNINMQDYNRIKSEINKSSINSFKINNYGSSIHPGFRIYEEVYTGSKKVLLVDDDPIIIDVGKQMLEKIGLEVIVAKNGIKAVELYERDFNKIDMVIIDMIMPGISGIETYHQLKRINPDIKVLFSSGYRKTSDINSILEKGKGGFIQKPFKMEELTKEIGMVLEL